MRTFVAATALVVAALAAGCSGADEAPARSAPTSATPTPDEDVPVVDSEACAEVRTGIDAFNDGDYDGTVDHFQAAVPLAEDQDDGSQAAGDLVEAVHYYADLAAEDYPEAARSSQDFAKYKAITLGQCVAAGGDDSGSGGSNV